MKKVTILLTVLTAVAAGGSLLGLVACKLPFRMPWEKDTEVTTSESSTETPTESPTEVPSETPASETSSEDASSETSTEEATTEKEKKSVTITYDFMTDTMENQTITGYVGEELSLLTPEREGYDFLGWYTSESYTKSYVDHVFPSTNKTLYAKWDAKTYTITFDPYNNGMKSMLNFKYGETIDYPTFTKDGYTFEGWYKGETKYTAVTMPAENFELSAAWSVNIYHYSYELNGGTNDENNKTTYTVEMDGKSLLSPTKTGYTFAGWYKTEDFSGTRVYDYPTEDCTFYAKWSVNAYALTLTSAHGDYGTTVNNYDYGETVTLPIPTAEGYTFLGWYDGDTKVESFVMTGDYSLTAKWELVPYTITYELDGGTLTSDAPTTYTVESELNEIIKALKATKTGYTFVEEWYVNPECTRKFTALPGGDFTLYAQYNINDYTIHYDVNGGDALVTEDVSVTYNSVPAAVTPTRTNYTFEGWAWNDEKIDSSAFTMPAENITLKAIWAPVPYTVNYDLGYSDLTDSATWGYDTTVKLIEPTRTGYTFLGWYDADGNRQEDNFSMPAEDVALTAHWSINSYTLHYDVAGGDSLDDVSVVYDTNPALATPTRTGYTFLGWTLNNEAVDVDTFRMPAEDVTLTATWKANTYKVTYDLNYDGTATSEEEHDFGTTVTLNVPEDRTGYTFVGWFLDEETQQKEDFSMPDHDVTLTAHWAVNTYSIHYDLNYDSLSSEVDKKYAETVTLYNPTRSGYTLLGWFDVQGNKQEDNFSMPAKNLVLTAHWAKNYNLTLDYGYDSKITESIQAEGLEFDLETLSRTGYIFDGWFNGDTKVVETTVTMPSSDLTLTAHWTVIHYSITYHYDDELQGTKVESYTVEDEVTFPTVTRDQADFTGWWNSDYSTQYESIAKGSTGDLELYAQVQNYFNWSNGTITGLTTYGRNKFSASSLITIPSSIQGDTITTIKLGSSSAILVTNVVIEEGITKIDGSCFYMWRMANVTIPSTVTTIGGYAFSQCSRLTTLTFTASDKNLSIGSLAFGSTAISVLDFRPRTGTISLTTATWNSGKDDYNDNGALNTMTSLKTLYLNTGFTAFHTHLFSTDMPVETIEYPGTKKSFESAVLAASSIATISFFQFGTWNQYAIHTSDGASIDMDGNTTLSIVFYKDGVSQGPTTIRFVENGTKDVALYTEPDTTHYFSGTVTYTDSSISDSTVYTKTITLKPYPCKVYETTTEGYLTYTVTFKDVGDTNYSSYATKTIYVTGGSAVTALPTDVTKTGYYFTGWKYTGVKSSGSITQITGEMYQDYVVYPTFECLYKTTWGLISDINKEYYYKVYGTTDTTLHICKYDDYTDIGYFSNSIYWDYDIDGYAPGIYTNFTSVVVGDGILTINKDGYESLFSGKQWPSVELPGSLTYIGEDSMVIASGGSIKFNGTKAQWATLMSNSSSNPFGSGTHSITVTCSDGYTTVTGA